MKALITILLILPVLLLGKPLPTLEELYAKTDRLLYMEKNQVRVERIDSTTPVYMAYAYATINASFEDVAPVLSDFDNYEAVFKHIVELKPIKDVWNPRDTLYYVEGKTSFLHGWGIGKITKFDSTEHRIDLEIRPASNAIVNKYRKKNKGVMKYYIKKVHLDGMLISMDDNQCRIGIRGVSSTNKPVPTWILSLIMKIIFPGLIKDIVKYTEISENTVSGIGI